MKKTHARKNPATPRLGQEGHLDYSDYEYKPLVIDAAIAHQQGFIAYKNNGTVVLRHPGLTKHRQRSPTLIPPQRQFSTIMATFMALDKTLTQFANSPVFQGGKTLRQKFDTEYAEYLNLVRISQKAGEWEPDYGSYVFDGVGENLYLVAPEFWYRLGLVTSTAKLLTDPEGKLSWWKIRQRLERAVVGFVGASVGGNILEGAARELRFRVAKVADPDYLEITNLNRFERGSLRYLVKNRGERRERKNPYELQYVNKAVIAAYEQNLVDPYTKWYVYSEGVHSSNVTQFLLGRGDEPRIDILVEESDNFRLKAEIRQLCRKHRIPVLMLSDFGHRAHGQFQDYRRSGRLRLGYKSSDRQFLAALNRVMTSGNRDDLFAFAKTLCGNDFAVDEFKDWVDQRGEQPTSNIPQSGTTALTSGGIGGKIIAFYLLGYRIPGRFIYDLRRYQVSVD